MSTKDQKSDSGKKEPPPNNNNNNNNKKEAKIVSWGTPLGCGAQGIVLYPTPPSLHGIHPMFSESYGHVLKVVSRPLAQFEKKIAPLVYRMDPDRKRYLSFEPNVEYTVTAEQQQALSKTPSVYPFLGYILTYGGPCYSTRLNALTGKTQPWYSVLNDFTYLLESLLRMHECGLVHRDIKATNLVYNGSLVRMIDFGIALSLSSPTLEQDMNVRPFEIWSMELNAKAFATTAKDTNVCGQNMWTWLHQSESTKAWHFWLEYWKLNTLDETHRCYQSYILEHILFWRQQQPQPQPSQSQQRLSTVQTMLKQNDVFQLGLLFLSFVIKEYIPRTRRIRHAKLLQQWINTVLVPMINPDYRHRMTAQDALHHHFLIAKQLTYKKPSSNNSTVAANANATGTALCPQSGTTTMDNSSHSTSSSYISLLKASNTNTETAFPRQALASSVTFPFASTATTMTTMDMKNEFDESASMGSHDSFNFY